MSARSVLRRVALATTIMAGMAWIGPASSASAAEAYAELPGVRLWYFDSGGSGVPVILLHANTGTIANWAKQIPALTEAGFRVIAFDRRGWGKSFAEASTGPQPGSIAGDLDALVSFLHLDRFCLLGVAGGGFSALDYAAWHPEKVQALVVAASTGLVAEPEVDGFFKNLLIPGFDKLPETFIELSPNYRGSNPTGTAAWGAIEEHSRQSGAPSQPLRTRNTYAKLETIIAPTLVVAAGADLLAPPALMRLWSAHVSRAEWAEIPDVGHSIAWEQPDAFNRLLLNFLRRFKPG